MTRQPHIVEYNNECLFIDESSLREHVTLNITNTHIIKQCLLYYFYIILRSYSKCLRRITEPLWRLTFWTFHLGLCDVTRPLSSTPRPLKSKQFPLTQARNAHKRLLIHLMDIYTP